MRPSIEIKRDEVYALKIEAGCAVRTRATKGMFSNSDTELCPILEYVLTDDQGEPLSTEDAGIVKIDEEGKLEITAANFTTGRDPIKLIVMARTGFAEEQLNKKRIDIEEKSQCDLSREM